jgi:hypothetical protein
MAFVREPDMSQGFGGRHALVFLEDDEVPDEVFGARAYLAPYWVILIVQNTEVTLGGERKDDTDGLPIVRGMTPIVEENIS